MQARKGSEHAACTIIMVIIQSKKQRELPSKYAHACIMLTNVKVYAQVLARCLWCQTSIFSSIGCASVGSKALPGCISNGAWLCMQGALSTVTASATIVQGIQKEKHDASLFIAMLS